MAGSVPVTSRNEDPLINYLVTTEPHYQPAGNEITLFEAAHFQQLPVMLKGPTGCGKTRFVEYMAWRLGRPLITVACHEDLSAADLVGRYLLDEKGTHWQDGPLALAARFGAICYLDEIVEARQDSVVAIHPLTDFRRQLPLERCNELIRAHPRFQLVISYNPGYQGLAKRLKESTRQRFTAIDFDWPAPAVEARIIAGETGINEDLAHTLVTIAGHSRKLAGRDLTEGMSTRMLIHAARLAAAGVALADACRVALIVPLTDDPDQRDNLEALVAACL